WEAKPAAESAILGRAFVRENNRWRRALTVPCMLDGVGTGNLCRLREQNYYGRELPVATVLASGEAALVKWLKKAIGARVVSPKDAWRHLGLVEPDGTPTRRGMIFSFFHGGEGLAVAVALEDETYPIDELVFDLANIRAGPRFAGEDAPMGGRLGILCQRIYGRADYPGYLSMGVPVQYGAGASEVVRG